MKKLTKRQRNRIYRKGYSWMLEGEGNNFICGLLAQVQGDWGGLINLEDFPEFSLFKPTEKEQEGTAVWFNLKLEEINKTRRLIVLAFCIAMSE